MWVIYCICKMGLFDCDGVVVLWATALGEGFLNSEREGGGDLVKFRLVFIFVETLVLLSL